jgi:hypothetical protein
MLVNRIGVLKEVRMIGEKKERQPVAAAHELNDP